MSKPLEYLSDLLRQIDELPARDDQRLDSVRKRAEMIVRNIFGDTSKYLKDLSEISFYPMVYPADESYFESSWATGVGSLRNLVHTMLEEIELFGITPETDTPSPNTPKPESDVRVFIVHGHDETSKSKVARFVEKLGMSAVILHERADAGKTIIEKFEHEASKVAFAIVLLTADDLASAKGGNGEPAPRARQNVVFELGYFVGSLGRENVVALREPGVEMPSDFAGVIYINLDGSESWRLALAREMKTAGIEIDMNRAI